MFSRTISLRCELIRVISTVAAGILAILSLTPAAWADSSTSTSVSVVSGTGSCGGSNATSSGCSAGSNYDFSGLGDTVSTAGAAAAVASFGSLGTSGAASSNCGIANPSIVNCSPYTSGSLFANASFSDVLTLSGEPSSGNVVFNIQTMGQSVITCGGASGSPACGGGATTSLIIPGSSFGPEQTIVLPNGTTDYSIDFGFSAGSGSQVPIEFILLTQVQCSNTNFTTCSASSNFINTAQVLGVSVTDLSGNVDSGATITADSGTNYNDISGSPVPTPESSSLSLLGAGFLSLIGVSKLKAVTA
jgi:hypothetical protein